MTRQGPGGRKPNRLLQEKSPYLLQHAYNPVDWHAWGEEAVAAARAADKPLFVSIGYSTCHWCHVMERESFEDDDIAAILNAEFVCVKIDREERPDLDRIYMGAVQAMTGSGGWPLNVFLTPQLKPFLGGTYFPPEARFGRPGFPDVLKGVARIWKSKRPDVERQAAALWEAIAVPSAGSGTRGGLSEETLEKAFRSLEGAFDSDRGGFGGAPRFPMPVYHNFLLRYFARTGECRALDMAARTLRAMSRGGIFDNLGGGFHRYSTDDSWRIPHFEKMLYDNAQLACNYVEVWQASGDSIFLQIARDILEYLLRDMRDPAGAFYSAEDADSEIAAGSEKKEGAFYLWRESELRAHLGADAELFMFLHGIRAEGNAVADPHGEFAGLNVLYQAREPAEAVPRFAASVDDALRALERSRKALFEIRRSRPRPARDEKILSSWNGLAVSAFAKGFRAAGDARYLDAARAAAGFIRAELWAPDAAQGPRLFHCWARGGRNVPGMACDYAFLAQGLLDLYEAAGEKEWLDWAIELVEEATRLFEAEDGGVYLAAAGEGFESGLARVLEETDNVEPSASSVMALNRQRLARLTERSDFRRGARKTLERFARLMAEQPMAEAQMLCVLDFELAAPVEIAVVGRREDAEFAAMAAAPGRRFLPTAVVALVEMESQAELAKTVPFVGHLAAVKGRATGYWCENYSCRAPSVGRQDWEERLREVTQEAPRC
jgi:uncharacterized protein YyaL (SSP411 family)